MLRPLRRAAPLLLLAVLVAIAVALGAGGSEKSQHHLTATLDEAFGFMPGLEVRSAGRPVGEVADVDATRQGKARLRLRLDDDVWPLPRGTKIQLRTAGTIAYSGRFVELHLPRKAGGPTMPEGSAFAARDIAVPVEVDDVFSSFDERTRRHLRVTVDRSGAALGTARPDLRRAIVATPPALQEAAGLLRDLHRDDAALKQLLRSTDNVTAAVERADPGVGRLLETAATTLGAVSERTSELRTAMKDAPETLDGARTTLGRASSTLDGVDELADRVDPGVDELRRATAPLNRTLTTLRAVAPSANRAVRTLGSASPRLGTLLSGLRQKTAPRLRSLGGQLDTQLNCIRPYAPELAAVATNWSGFLQFSDGLDKVARLLASSTIFPNATPLNSTGVSKVFPVQAQNPRPAGALSGQPYFQPECGTTPASLTSEGDVDNR